MAAIVLVGLRGAGKTTIGRLAANELGFGFVDADAELAAAVGRSVGDLLAAVGEPEFRRREAGVVLPLLAAADVAVIATGGGAVTIPAVRTALAAPTLFVVWLQADVDTLAARLAAAARHGGPSRPPLTSLPPAAELRALAAARAPLYRQVADDTVDTAAGDAANAALEVAQRFRRWQAERSGRSS
ncbi:MAG: shikimate kinase [Planctomycetes bacterium]|nr:shikimate kinase [Planctomycetota bacterium]